MTHDRYIEVREELMAQHEEYRAMVDEHIKAMRATIAKVDELLETLPPMPVTP